MKSCELLVARIRCVTEALLAGHSRADIARITGTSPALVRRILGDLARHGNAGRMIGVRVRVPYLAKLDAVAGRDGISRQDAASQIVEEALERPVGRVLPRVPVGPPPAPKVAQRVRNLQQ